MVPSIGATIFVRDNASCAFSSCTVASSRACSARVRREAHETVLAQRSAIRAELQRQVAEAATALQSDPRYAELVARLTERCRAMLGQDAVVAPSPHGGVVATSGSRHLDLSLPTLAAQTLEAVTGEVSGVWTP